MPMDNGFSLDCAPTVGNGLKLAIEIRNVNNRHMANWYVRFT
jgi:hypothetical protein